VCMSIHDVRVNGWLIQFDSFSLSVPVCLSTVCLSTVCLGTVAARGGCCSHTHTSVCLCVVCVITSRSLWRDHCVRRDMVANEWIG